MTPCRIALLIHDYPGKHAISSEMERLGKEGGQDLGDRGESRVSNGTPHPPKEQSESLDQG